jgi:predicted PurR-regulated permease PerM
MNSSISNRRTFWKSVICGVVIAVVLLTLHRPVERLLAQVAVDRGWSFAQSMLVSMVTGVGAVVFTLAIAWFFVLRSRAVPDRPISWKPVVQWKHAVIGFLAGILLIGLRRPFVEFFAQLAVDRRWSLTASLWIFVASLVGILLFVAIVWFLIARIFQDRSRGPSARQ